MKFTLENFQTEFPKIQSKASPKLQKHYKNAVMLAPKYHLPAVKKAIDNFLKIANEFYGDKTPAKSPQSPKSQKAQKEKTPKEKPSYSGKYVEKILPEVSFIKRYTHFHEQKLTADTKDKARKLLTSLQKAIVEKQIRKTSDYATEINAMQSSLIKIVNARADGSVIDIASIDKLREIAASQKVSDTAIIKSFLAIQGKEGVKEKAQVLLKKAEYVSDQYSARDERIPFRDVKIALRDYINGKTHTPEVSAQALQGLYVLAGVEIKPEKGKIIKSTEFLGAVFDQLPLAKQYKELLGAPPSHAKIMIYGKAGSGKSTLALRFAGYLSQDLGKSVLYIADEEQYGAALWEKTNRYSISNPNLDYSDEFVKNPKGYDFVFIDSVNSSGLSIEDLQKMPADIGYVWVFQCTKNGRYKGSQAFEHEADIVIEVDAMKAHCIKNRFGPTGYELNVAERTLGKAA